jgi:tetratricopeptide (TPR) repeat protein
MNRKLKILVSILVALLFVGCKPLVEDGLTYYEYVKRAAQYRNDGDYDRAIAACKKAVSIKPNDGETHYMLATVYYEAYNKSFDAAQKKRIAAFVLNPQRRQKQDLIEEYKKYGLRPELNALAIQEFKETLKYSPDNWWARYLIATDYFNKKQFREAIDEYKMVIEINPKYINSYSLMGEAYFEIGEYQAAIKILESGIRVDPTDQNSYYTLGRAYRKVNNDKKVAENLEKLKSMHSTFYDSLLYFR